MPDVRNTLPSGVDASTTVYTRDACCRIMTHVESNELAAAEEEEQMDSVWDGDCDFLATGSCCRYRKPSFDDLEFIRRENELSHAFGKKLHL